MPIPYIPAALREFKSSVPLTEDLRLLLESPTMVKLIRALREVPLPRKPPEPTPGVHHDTTIAHQFHWAMGFNECLDQIIRASLPPGQVSQDDLLNAPPVEYEDAIPPALRQSNRPQKK